MLQHSRTAVTIGLAAATLCFLGCGVAASDRGTFDRTLTVTGPVRLELSNGSGGVYISGGQSGQVKIHAEVRAGGFLFGNPQHRLADVLSNPPIEQRGDTIRIGKDGSRLRNISITYTIEVPRETEVEASVGSGTEELRDIRGPAKLTTGSGSIHVRHVEREATFGTGSGSIEGEQLGDDVRATTGSGSITLSGVKGDISGNTGSGKIHVSLAGGRVQLSTGSGTITVNGAANDLNVRAASGTITVSGNPAANSSWEMHTASGSVELLVPPSANFLFSANAHSGGIQTDIPIVVEEQSRHELRARLGNGGARVEVHTASGSIRVRSSGSTSLE